MRITVLLNGAAGTVAAGRAGLDIAGLRGAFERAGVTAEVLAVPGRELAQAARAAVDAGVDAVVAGGGDGTVSAVASVLAGTNTPLGVLPLGTLNHFAKDTGVPLDLEVAVATIAEGHTRAVDVAEVNGHTFVNNSSIGLYPQIVRVRDAQRVRLRRGKWPAMVAAALGVFRRFPLMGVRLRVGGKDLVMTTPFVFVGNNEYRMDLLNLGARLRVDGGALSVYAAQCTSRLALLRLALLALLRRLEQSTDFVTRCTDEVWVHTRRHALRVSLDGEVIALTGALHYRIRPRALKVLLPEPVDPATGEPRP